VLEQGDRLVPRQQHQSRALSLHAQRGAQIDPCARKPSLDGSIRKSRAGIEKEIILDALRRTDMFRPVPQTCWESAGGCSTYRMDSLGISRTEGHPPSDASEMVQ